MQVDLMSRRREPRMAVDWTVSVRNGTLGRAALDVRDVGTAGARLSIPAHLAPRQADVATQVIREGRIELTFVSNDWHYTTKGEVRWHAERSDGGLEFGVQLAAPLPTYMINTAAAG